ncbi:MAG: integration host factor subunit beta [Magnetococcales bacterium]|nr:integration host factor subunit beta [Magnetococcales bacterium]MBF0150663.1 integration host factor subunit beta [Magnetococcales bacterium]MBF0173427.1 integration host factor subunit beta [Magnetococcales bacterium]MBF0346341.1 integration host factor subunit beta [Magnetococcales bacterium]
MTKTDLVRLVAERHRLPVPHVAEIIDAALGAIVQSVAEGETVRLRGFGQFVQKLRPPRKGRSLVTGSAVTIPAKRVAVFKPGSQMRYHFEDEIPEIEDPSNASVVEIPEKTRKSSRPDPQARLREAIVNIREIRDHTTFLWRRLQTVKKGGGSLSCQIRSSTYFQVEENLEWLHDRGFFKFAVHHAQDQREEGVMQLRVYDITDEFNELVVRMIYDDQE